MILFFPSIMSSCHSITISHHACLTFNYVRYYLSITTFCHFKNFPGHLVIFLSCNFLLYELHWMMACCDFNYSISIQYRLTACTWARKPPLISRCERFRRKRRKLSTSINIVEWSGGYPEVTMHVERSSATASSASICRFSSSSGHFWKGRITRNGASFSVLQSGRICR